MIHLPVRCSLLLALATSAAAQDLLVQAARIVIAPDQVLTGSALLVRDGKIAYVGSDIPGEARAAARRVDYGDAVLSPGFVLAVTTLGRDDDLAEAALPFTPDLRAAEAFDPWLDRLATLAPSGVTSLGFAPSARNVAGGIGALVKPGTERGRIAADDVFVVMSLAREARQPERPPTSLMGQKELLRDVFETARAGIEVGPDLEVLRQVMSGSRRALVHADTFAELSAALELAEGFGFAPVLVGAREADRLLPRLAARGAGVVLDTLDPGMRLEQLRLPAQLAEAGVPFCFGGRLDRLRLSAALAVRHGLDRKTALAALTRTPATLLGQQAAVGALRQGNSADFVVFSGDLLDLGARHVATWIDGALVAGSAPARNPSTAAATAAGAR